jgi:hypothetical protein
MFLVIPFGSISRKDVLWNSERRVWNGVILFGDGGRWSNPTLSSSVVEVQSGKTDDLMVKGR